MGEPIHEERSVRETGQTVVKRVVGEFLLELHPLSEIVKSDESSGDIGVVHKISEVDLVVAIAAIAIVETTRRFSILPFAASNQVEDIGDQFRVVGMDLG